MKTLGFFPPSQQPVWVGPVPRGKGLTNPPTAYHDEPLGQPGPGEEVDHPQPLRQAQVPERRRLQGDGVGGGGPHRRLAFVALRAAGRLRRGHAGFCRQAFVQISELPGEKPRRESRGGECLGGCVCAETAIADPRPRLSSHLHPRVTESQNSRGWKGPLWVI